MKKPKTNSELRAASVERLLACALGLFVHNGYRGTTLDVVAARAGLTKGAIYFYFKTKEAVMLRLLEEAEAVVVDPVVELMEKTASPAAQKLVSFIHHQSLLGLTHPQHILLLILSSIEFHGSGSDIEARLKAIYRRLNACVEDFVRQGQTEGSFRNDVTSELLTAVVVAAHDGVLLEWYRRPKELEGKTLTRAMSSMLVAGLNHVAESDIGRVDDGTARPRSALPPAHGRALHNQARTPKKAQRTGLAQIAPARPGRARTDNQGVVFTQAEIRAIRDFINSRKLQAKRLKKTKNGAVAALEARSPADPGFLSALEKISKRYQQRL